MGDVRDPRVRVVPVSEGVYGLIEFTGELVGGAIKVLGEGRDDDVGHDLLAWEGRERGNYE